MRSYIAVTRGGELSDLKALFDATKDSTDGIGSTPTGALTFVDERQGATSTINGDTGTLWPVGEDAPFMWAVAPEDGGDIDLYRLNNEPASVLDDPLLIDGVLYRAARLVYGGLRPTGNLTVRASRARRIVDASARTVEFPAPGKVRVTRARPPQGQPIQLASRNPLSPRNLSDSVVVWDNSANQYRVMSLRTLLAGAVDEPDTGTRYVALKAGPAAGPAPDFLVADIEAGGSGTGVALGVPFPTVPVTQADEGVFLAVAVPAGEPFSYFALGGINGGLNGREGSFPADPTDNLTLTSGDSFDVYVRPFQLNPAFLGSTLYGYFDRDATNPPPPTP